MQHRPFRSVYRASSERDLPRVRLVDMKTAADVAAAMASHFGASNEKYRLSPETARLLMEGVTDEQAADLVKAWTAKNPVDGTMFFKKGNTRIIDKIVGTIHDGSYNGRYVSLFLQWDELKDMKRKDVSAFIGSLTPTQQALMSIAAYVTTSETRMASYVRGLQSQARLSQLPSQPPSHSPRPEASKRPRSPSPSSSRKRSDPTSPRGSSRS